MSMFPDPDEMDAIAERIAAHARAARSRSLALGHAVAATGWRGPAADAFGGAAEILMRALHACAGRLDDAADALRRHARSLRHDLAVLHQLRSTLLGAGIDVLDLVRDGVLTPAELVQHAGGMLHRAADLLATGGVLDDAGGLLHDAGTVVGDLLGIR